MRCGAVRRVPTGATAATDKGAKALAKQLFLEACPAGSEGVLPPQSGALWTLCRGVAARCLPFLDAEDQTRVALALPKLAAAGAPPSGISLAHFLTAFSGLYSKLQLRAKAEALARDAAAAAEGGEVARAADLYAACLEVAPRRAEAHLARGLLLWMADSADVPANQEVHWCGFGCEW